MRGQTRLTRRMLSKQLNLGLAYLVTRAPNDGTDEILCGTLGGVNVGLESRSIVIIVGSHSVCFY